MKKSWTILKILSLFLLFPLLDNITACYDILCQLLNLDAYSISGCRDNQLVDSVTRDSIYINKDLGGEKNNPKWLWGHFKCMSRSHNLLQVNKLQFSTVFGNYCIHTSEVRPRHYGWLEFI